MSLIQNDLNNKHFKIKVLIPAITLSVVCCIVVIIFSILIINRVQNSNMYLLSEFLILLVVLTSCIFLTRYITNSLIKEILTADETVQKLTEENIMLENIKEIMDGLELMVFVTDPKTNEILFMNQTMKQYYGVEGDAVGQICYKVLKRRGEKRCGFCPCISLDKEPGKIIVWDEHTTDTNCIYRRVDRYIKWPNGKTVHIQHSIDMTELINAKEAAEMSNRSKGIFLAQMSHEIRTPMNAILGISEIQLHDKTLSANAEEGYRKIYESGNLLLNIINDILDFSKIDAGKLEIVCTQYEIPELINNAVQLNCMRFKHKPLSIKINLDKNTPHDLIGDGLRIKQILNNLLSNAFKYTDKGEVELSVHAETGFNDKTVILVLKVRDTGQGMTENQVLRIFDEYSRFNLDTNRSISGTGLGMSITKRLIDIMNGEIHVESKPCEGSIFTVRLPQTLYGSAVCGEEAVKNLQEFNFRGATLHKKTQIVYEQMPYGKVLVVDDVTSNLLVAKGLLMPYGLNIETSNNGFEAIEKIKTNKQYDIIFMDHMMPGIDGIKTTNILRAMGYTQPIVALTANAVIGQEEVFLSNGFDGFIPKPIDSCKLNRILIEFIKDKNLEKGIEETALITSKTQQKSGIEKIIENNELAVAVTIDLKNSISVLEDLLFNSNIENKIIELFTTTVHGIKSVLANIEEKQLSDIAYKLEQAGINSDTSVILKETPEFIINLKSLIEKINLPVNLSEQMSAEIYSYEKLSHDDLIYLQDKLNEIKTACGTFKPKDAKNALTELKQKTFPYIANNILNEISLHLIRGEFSKVISAVDAALLFVNKRKIPNISAHL
ncbi:MAG: ATP-binding protein [Treponema sp.]|nr:ATP-binding protein [Treponema sp.]